MKTIACLPIAGTENPYQQLMMEGLRQGGHSVRHGAGGKWFAFSRTWLGMRPDYIHLDWPGSYYLRRSTPLALLQFAGFWLDLAVFRLAGGKLVWTCHNLKEHEVPHPEMDVRAKRILAAAARKIRVFSEGQLEQAVPYLKTERAKLVVVPEGSYVEYYPNQATRQEARELLGLPADKRVAVNFGNLRPYKGIDRLIQAFNALQPEGWHLLIAGPAHNRAYVNELKRMAEGNPAIHIRPGFVKSDEVQNFMRAADLAVFPFNRIDNSGSVILAMGFGLPVVAPATGAVKGRLKAQPDLLFENGRLEEKLTQAFAMGAEQLKVLGAANEQALQEFSWQDFSRIFER